MTEVDAPAVQTIVGGLQAALIALATRGIVLFALAFAASKLAHSLAAKQRHALWLAVLLMLAILPAAQLLPVIRVPLLDLLPAGQGPLPAIPQPESVSSELVPGSAEAAFQQPWGGVSAAGALLAAAAAWAAGALIVAARPIAGRLALRGIVRSDAARRVPEAIVEAFAKGVDVRGVRVLAHPRVTVPFTYGLRHPTILLPRAWSAWTPRRLEAVLVHELAHVRRRDARSNAAAQAACAILWFYPMAWAARSFLLREAELSCDEEVLSHGVPRSEYASTMVALLRGGGGGYLRPLQSALGRTALLKERVARILAPGPGSDGPGDARGADGARGSGRLAHRRSARALLIAAAVLSVPLMLSVSLRGAERLEGAWRTPSAMLPKCVQVWNADGSGTTASAALPDVPAARCRYSIDNKWTDADGFTWYHIRARWTGMPFLLYTLIRLNPSATAYELTDSPLGYPAGFVGSPGDNKHQVFVRR